jgi:hypothetical protein
MRYTIEYTKDRDGAERRDGAQVFRDKQDAFDGAAL